MNSSKKEWMNSFLLVCDVFLFIEMRIPKRHFEIIWPLVWLKIPQNLSAEAQKSGISKKKKSFIRRPESVFMNIVGKQPWMSKSQASYHICNCKNPQGCWCWPHWDIILQFFAIVNNIIFWCISLLLHLSRESFLIFNWIHQIVSSTDYGQPMKA